MTANERLAEIKANLPATHPNDALGARRERNARDMLAALEAVLELHKPVDVEPCDTICGECSYRLPNGRYMPTVEHPCPTVEAINEALGVDQ